MKRKLFIPVPVILLAASLAFSPCHAPAAEASPSELLEKGIYAEETKGDVDAAITIYQQLLAQAKTVQSLAAQAQFRLAQCYLKKNKTAEAEAAFEKLVRDYPEEKELVAKAREHLPGAVALAPVSWVDGERLFLNLKLAAAGMDAGVVEYRANLVNVEGRKLWRVGARMSVGVQSVSTVDVEPETFRPLKSHWKYTIIGDTSAVYGKTEVELHRAGAKEVTKLPFDDSTYDNEEVAHLMRRLPLKVGYKTSFPVLSTLGGGASIPLSLEVTAEEPVEVPAGKFDCFRVKLSVGQTFWYSADAHRYLVKFEAGPVVAELTSIAQRKSSDTVEFRDEDLHVSLTTPADWLVYRPRKGQSSKQPFITLADPDANATESDVRVVPTESLPEASRQSARAWAEASFGADGDTKVRPESWKNYEVDGLTGVGCVADSKQGDKPQVQFRLYVIGPKNAESFMLSSDPEKFDALRAEFERIIASYKRW